MQIYNVGKTELNPEEFCYMADRGYEWIVYVYSDYDGYSGGGDAIALLHDERLGDALHYYNLEHCSCYGPLDASKEMDSISVDHFINSDSIHDIQVDSTVREKVLELLK